MLDPLSIAAITAVLGAVGSGVASEAGKWAWETAGGLVRRMAGREVAAPTRPEERDAVARIIHDSVRSDPELARTWDAFARTVQTSGATTGRPRLPSSVRFFTDRKGAMRLAPAAGCACRSACPVGRAGAPARRVRAWSGRSRRWAHRDRGFPGGGSEEYGGAERRGVIGDGTVVPDDHVGREQGLTPVLQRVDQRQAGAPGPVQPGPDPAGAVTVPDVGVEHGGDAVLVDGKLRREPRKQRGQRVVTAPPPPPAPSPLPSPRSDGGLQVELSSTSRCPRPTPSALRNRSR